MNRRVEIIEGLRAFLTGLGSRSRGELDFIATYERWPDLAAREFERRAMAMLAGLTIEDLSAILREDVDLAEAMEARTGRDSSSEARCAARERDRPQSRPGPPRANSGVISTWGHRFPAVRWSHRRRKGLFSI